MDDEEYKKEYDKAAAALEDEAAKATTPRAPDGKFAKAEAVETPPEPVAATEKPPEPDPMQELRERLERQEKALKDTQAWGTRNAQELAALKKAKDDEVRAAKRPQILDQNPELADAIRYVAADPQPANHEQMWAQTVAAAHPGIFDVSIDPELEKALLARRDALGQQWFDPLVAIREITTEKLAHAERSIGKRFAAEAAKLQQKSAMSVPGAGGTSVGASSPMDEVDRIRNLSEADFAREVRKVKGY